MSQSTTLTTLNNEVWDCIIIGAGIAGLQCAIQLGRYQHHILVLDKNDGRSTLCRKYKNILGWPDGVSGLELRRLGQAQAERTGVQFKDGFVNEVLEQNEPIPLFHVKTLMNDAYLSRTLVLATGVRDTLPPIPGLLPALGLSIFVCPDCDGYESRQQPTVVLGSGEPGANMALTLLHWTKQITFINHDSSPLKPDTIHRLSQAEIPVRNQAIRHVELYDDNRLRSILLAHGEQIQASVGFVAFGGNQVKSELAAQLGVSLGRGNHVETDPTTKATSKANVWAVGDVVAHSEQVSIAMGDGSQAAIYIHKALIEARTK